MDESGPQVPAGRCGGNRLAAWRMMTQPSASVRTVGAAALASSLSQMFAADPGRADAYAVDVAGVHIDLSKTHLTAELVSAAEAWWQTGGARWLADVAAGAIVNGTEQRAALHSAWRDPAATDPIIAETNAKMQAIVADWRASDAKAILHLGIGGSALGPDLALAALSPREGGRFDVRVVANIDAEAVLRALRGLDPKRTRVILASKSWTTLETQSNAALLRRWFADGGVALDDVSVAISERTDLALASGLPPERVLALPAWVGGRYSLWSAIGLPLALQLGWDGLAALRAGAHAMDQHALSAPFARNAVLLSALAGWLYTEIAGYGARAVFAYDERLKLLPAHLAQLEMESLGKSVGRDGSQRPTGAPVLWGGVGTDAQHAVFQALHQGPHVVPVDFVGVVNPDHGEADHHRQLMANMLAQSAVLLAGKDEAQVRAELGSADPALAPHKVFPGNRPSTTLLLDQLTPATLGAVIAFYEQRTVAQAAFWDINPFDQWGVEMGKVVARQLASGGDFGSLDSSTQALARRLGLG
jgi:glucose-6-phosphate isomerase